MGHRDAVSRGAGRVTPAARLACDHENRSGVGRIVPAERGCSTPIRVTVDLWLRFEFGSALTDAQSRLSSLRGRRKSASTEASGGLDPRVPLGVGPGAELCACGYE